MCDSCQREWANQLRLFHITDILLFARVEGEVANRSDQRVDTAGNYTQEEVCLCSGLISLRLQRGMIDDKTSPKAQEESEQKASGVIVFHSCPPKVFVYTIVLHMLIYVNSFDIIIYIIFK